MEYPDHTALKSAADFPSNFKDGHSPDDFTLKSEPTWALINHQGQAPVQAKEEVVGSKGGGKAGGRESIGESGVRSRSLESNTIQRLFLRYSFPLPDSNSHIATTFFLDSGTAGSAVLLSPTTKRELTKHKLLKESGGEKYLDVNGTKVLVKDLPKQTGQAQFDVLGIRLWPIFGVVTPLQGEKLKKEKSELENKLKTSRSGEPSVRETKTQKAERQEKTPQKTGIRLADVPEGQAEAFQGTQKVPIQLPVQESQKQAQQQHDQQRQAQRQQAKQQGPDQAKKSKSQKKRRKSGQKRQSVDFSKVSVDELSSQLEEPKFG